MSDVSYDFEGANGAAISGAGITLAGVGTAAYYNGWSVSGSSSAHTLPSAGNTRAIRCTFGSDVAQSFQGFGLMPVWAPAATTNGVGTLRNTAGALVQFRIKVDDAGHVGVEAGSTGFHSASGVINPGTPFRITAIVNVATGATTAKVYTGATFTTQSGSTYTGTLTYPNPAAPIDAGDFGSLTATTPPYDMYWDLPRTVSGSATELTPPTTITAPTANAGIDQDLQAGQTITLTGSGTVGTGGGSISGGTWTLVEKPRDAATPSFVTNTLTTTIANAEAGIYRFDLVVTQSGGGLSSPADRINIFVCPPTGVAVKPYLITRQAGITVEGGADEYATLVDNLTSTSFQWPTNPTGQTTTIVWNPIGPGPITTTFSGDWFGDANSINRVVTWYEQNGSTLLDGPYTHVLTTTTAAYAAGLDAGAMTQLTTAQSNRRNLVSVIADTQN